MINPYHNKKTEPFNAFAEKNNDFFTTLKESVERLRVAREYRQLCSEFEMKPSPNPFVIFPQVKVETKMPEFTMETNKMMSQFKLEIPGFGTLLGYKGYVCQNCGYCQIQLVYNDIPKMHFDFTHPCTGRPIAIQLASLKSSFDDYLHGHREELISNLSYIVNQTTRYPGSANLMVVEITRLVIEDGPEKYGEYVDLSPAHKIQERLYNAIYTHNIFIDNIELSEFLNLFLSTFGVVRLRTDAFHRYYFVYISNGLDPVEIGILRKLYMRTTDAKDLKYTNSGQSPGTINPNDYGSNQRIEPPGSGTTLGYESYVCEKCLRIALEHVLDSAARRSIRFNHICKGPVGQGSSGDLSEEVIRRKELLIECLRAIVFSTSQYQEKARFRNQG
jgi:hypothetical protein